MPFEAATFPDSSRSALRLGQAAKGFRGRIVRIGGAGADAPETGISATELERRLLEIGFVEGAPVEIVHEGLLGRDPIAIRVNETTVALRRREANAILVEATV
ncbi:MAG TPA: FeoA family protein [Candidatus Sulfotelmatobacter sp.]|nr:FeoA family protein [Candidatus Sulfotelmatobacter sp.]